MRLTAVPKLNGCRHIHRHNPNTLGCMTIFCLSGLSFGDLNPFFYQKKKRIQSSSTSKLGIIPWIYLTKKHVFCSFKMPLLGWLGPDEWPTAARHEEERFGLLSASLWSRWPLLQALAAGTDLFHSICLSSHLKEKKSAKHFPKYVLTPEKLV